MPHYVVTEPHPTVVENTYIHAGRGGAGNLFRAPLTTPPTGVPTATKASKTSSSSGRFYSGRGGAGNTHRAVERPVLSLDEEYAATEAREKTAAGGLVGRGGAGNFYHDKQEQQHLRRKASDASDNRRDSSSSAGSVRSSGLFGRLSSSIARHTSH